MRSLFIFVALLILPLETSAGPARECGRQPAEEPITYMNEFSWGQSREEMAKNFQELYGSGRRLKGRAYYDEALGQYVFPEPYGIVKIDPVFLKSVTRHLEVALEQGYAEHIFFPDMGHSHFYIPNADWEPLKDISARNTLYEKFFALRSLKVLYHTAEMLRVRPGNRQDGAFPQDPMLLWRYFSRNPVGDNSGGEQVLVHFQKEDLKQYNTVREIPGHFGYSAGFYVSASKDGCFPFRQAGEVRYFDLSLEEMPSKPVNGGGDSYSWRNLPATVVNHHRR